MLKIDRRTILWLWFLLAVLGFLPLAGLGMDTRGEYTILGVGNESCGKFVRERQQSIGAYPDHRYQCRMRPTPIVRQSKHRDTDTTAPILTEPTRRTAS
jgi:hypothetical protein